MKTDTKVIAVIAGAVVLVIGSQFIPTKHVRPLVVHSKPPAHVPSVASESAHPISAEPFAPEPIHHNIKDTVFTTADLERIFAGESEIRPEELKGLIRVRGTVFDIQIDGHGLAAVVLAFKPKGWPEPEGSVRCFLMTDLPPIHRGQKVVIRGEFREKLGYIDLDGKIVSPK